MTQFTASEVRELAATIWPDLSGREEVAETLNAFADLLEAQEKAVRVMVVNHVSSAEHDLLIGVKLYAHPVPSDAERLAEALRMCMDIMLEHGVPTHPDADARVAYTAAEQALAAHSAQAQPSAARVSDEMVERARSAFVKVDDGSTGITEAIRAALLAAQENPNG